jgi:N-acetylglucosamine-6-phosphate deacetylase
VRICDGVARTLDGVVAGSTSNLLKCVKKAMEFGIPENDAFYMASHTPAMLIGETAKGEIKEGFDADFVVIDDQFNVAMTISAGNVFK